MTDGGDQPPAGPAGATDVATDVSPVDAPRARRRSAAASALAIGAEAVLILALGVLGVAGYRGGFALATAIVGVTGAALALWIVPAGAPLRPAWAVSAVVAAAVISGLLVDMAPPSRGRLADQLDRLELTNLRVLGQASSGHSWCRPTCPVVERRYLASVGDRRGPLLDLAFALERRHLARAQRLVPAQLVDTVRLHQTRFDLVAVASFRTAPGGNVDGVLMIVRLTAHR